MNILNLDSQFPPFGPGLKFDHFTFNGGEPHFRLSDSITEERTIITFRIRSFNDMGLLLMAVDAVRRSAEKPISIELLLPYFPGARQDRVCNAGEPFSLKVYADLINSCAFTKVYVLDPHSAICEELVHNMVEISNFAFVNACLPNLPKDILLVAPDQGALPRVEALAQMMGFNELVSAKKKRNLATGGIISMALDTPNLKGRPCLIVDDICDGGATFLSLAEVLKNNGAGDLYLAITHGIFSKGLDRLATAFKLIFSTNSFQNQQKYTHPQFIHLSLQKDFKILSL